jgi:hypothetical protein
MARMIPEIARSLKALPAKFFDDAIATFTLFM